MATKKAVVRYDIWDLNMGAVPGYPVASPPGWDAISLHYARALQRMGWKQPASPDRDVEHTWTYSEQDPTAYYFQAAMHWTPKFRGHAPPPYRAYWDHCTHDSGDDYFLPWHRVFVYWFEAIIRSLVPVLDGPSDWALPYWDYGFHAAAGPHAPWPRATLPWVFCQPRLPDGSGNPLYMADVRRGLRPAQYLDESSSYYDNAYRETDFLGSAGLGGFTRALENQPHNADHGDVGRGGWMGSVPQAAFDPVFWLHHSEIDRFWVGWNAGGGPNPSSDTWLKAADDPNQERWDFWTDSTLSSKVRVLPGEMLDPAQLPAPFPHSYRYESLPQTPAPSPPGRVQRLAAMGGGPVQRRQSAAKNSVLGSAEDVRLGNETVSAPIALTSEASTELSRVTARAERAVAGQPPPRVILHLENVTADGPPPNYEVYLNYPDATYDTAGDHPHYVGILAGFGADHMHGEHAHGIKVDFDITDLVRYLERTGGWDPSRATITFVPIARRQPGWEAMTGTSMRVGSVSIRSLSESE